MPLTPETWLTEFTVNLTTAGVQARPRITQLANGNILVSWDSNANTGAGSAPGVDVLGQLFDPLGVPLGTEFRLNSTFSADDERNGDIAALPGGGFIVVYEDFEVANNTRSIRLAEYDASGNTVSDNETVIRDITNNADPAHFNPRVAVSSATSVMIVWQEEEVGGDSQISTVIYNPVTNTYSNLINAAIRTPGTNTSPEIAVLTNGNYVIVCATTQSNDSNDQIISYKILDPAGLGPVLPPVAATEDDSQFDRDASVAALTGGGFVISWTNTDANDTDIQAQIFDAAGVVQPGVLSPSDTGATNNAGSSFIVALPDGGFIIGFDEDANNTIVVQRYSAAGVEVGDAFVIASGAGSANPSGVLMDDGRIAITFQRANTEIGMEIIDIRDAVNIPVYTPDDYQIGTIGDDSFTVSAVFGYGHDGNDTILDGSGSNTIFGGLGNDTITIRFVNNLEEVYGGSGVDTLIGIAIGPDAIYNLLNGTVTDPFALEIQIAEGFEHVIGGVFSETFIGSSVNNSITGDGGDDTLFGGFGQDALFGGAGNDTLNGDGGVDVSFGGTGNDTFLFVGGDSGSNITGGGDIDLLDLSGWTSPGIGWEVNLQTGTVAPLPNSVGGADIYTISGVENVTGSGVTDFLTGDGLANLLNGGAGDDTLNGGGGIDTMNGGAGNDRFVVDAAGDAIAEITGEGAGDLLLASSSYVLAAGVAVEVMQTTSLAGTGAINLTGNALAQQIIGNAGDNVLTDGAGAADVLRGSLGNDIYVIRTGGSLIVEGVGEGTADRVLAAVNFALAADDHIEAMQTTSFAGLGAINLTGNALGQTIIGNAGANTLEDGAGAADTLNGSLGNDTYVIRTAGSLMVEAGGQGTADRVLVAVSFVLAGDDDIELMQTTSFAGVGAINLTGNALGQTIIGNAGANGINGAAGNDTLTGGAGADDFIFNTALGATNIDGITDFVAGLDDMLLRDTIFAGIGVGALAANEFHAGASGQAQTADTRIIYETDNGNLWYDADGNGAGLRVQFGDLAAGLAVTASDFEVF